jgi:hypothetical protein
MYNFVCKFYDSSVGSGKFSSTLKQIKTFATEKEKKKKKCKLNSEKIWKMRKKVGKLSAPNRRIIKLANKIIHVYLFHFMIKFAFSCLQSKFYVLQTKIIIS